MKRLVIAVAGVLFLGCLLTYILIPTIIVVKKSIPMENNQFGLQRALSDSSSWKQWWPGVINDHKLMLNEKEYRVPDHTFSSVLVDIQKHKSSVKSYLNIIALTKQSVNVEWITEMNASYNPYKRLTTLTGLCQPEAIEMKST